MLLVPHEDQEAPTFYVDGCSVIPCGVTSTPVLLQKDIEEYLAMGKIAKDVPFKSTSKGDYLFMDWVDKYISEIEDQGCTRIACISRGLFDMDDLKGKPHELPLWVVDYSLEEVIDHIPYGSKN